jgi:DNA-binding NarL/FixJ family response regulator
MDRDCSGSSMSEAVVPLRIVIADDQASIREGLVLLLGLLPDFDVVGAAANGSEALDLVETYRPDAILLDLHMPVLDGIETTRRLSERYPEVAIVILTTYADDASVLAALRAGARSFLTKDADRADIAHALRSAASGLSVLDHNVQASLLAAVVTPPEEAPENSRSRLPEKLPDGLTHREAQILLMISQGMSNPEIARALFLSAHTVKSHINRIFSKTGSTDRAAATRYAQDHNFG